MKGQKISTGVMHYGETFTGYMKPETVIEHLPAFKEFYVRRKRENPDMSNVQICRAFNDEVMEPKGLKFHVHQTHLSKWEKKWDSLIIPQDLVEVGIDGLMPPTDADLEVGMRMLGGELVKDARRSLHEAQSEEDGELSLKRRNYVVSVFSHVTKLVHGKANIMLKQSEEKRNTASFLMGLLSKASAGTITDEEIEVLESSYQPKQQDVKVIQN